MPFPSFFWIENTKNYISIVENSFIDEDKKITQEFEELKKEKDKEYAEFKSESLIDDSYSLEFVSKQLFRHSTLISIYSFIEYQLKKICDSLDTKMFLPMKPKDFAGSGVDKYSKYLLYVSSIDIKKDKKYFWEELERFKKIRNILVHESGVVKKTDIDINNYIKSNSNLSLEHDKLFIKERYITDQINLAEEFFNSLENDLEEKLPNIFNDEF